MQEGPTGKRGSETNVGKIVLGNVCNGLVNLHLVFFHKQVLDFDCRRGRGELVESEVGEDQVQLPIENQLEFLLLIKDLQIMQ